MERVILEKFFLLFNKSNFLLFCNVRGERSYPVSKGKVGGSSQLSSGGAPEGFLHH
jgi:hypothetical protein